MGYPCGKDSPDQLLEAFEGTVRPRFEPRKSFAQPSVAAIKFLKSLLKVHPEIRASCTRALSSEYLTSSMKTTLTSEPSFGPTLAVAYSTTKAEPLEETPKVVDTPPDDEVDLWTGETMDCGSSEEGPPLPPRHDDKHLWPAEL